MPRYYFHLNRPDGLDRDDIGLELPNLEAAYLGAFEAILPMTVDLTRRNENPRRYAFEIADETGTVLLDVPFSEFLDRGRRPTAPQRQPRRAGAEAARTVELIAAIGRERDALTATLAETRRLLAAARRAVCPPV